jgi:inositol transport system substrate-binding protein
MKSKSMVTIACLILVLLSAISFPACQKKQETSGPQKFKIGYTNNADSDYFDKFKRDEFEKVAKADPELDVVFTNANMDMQQQLDQIDNFITQKMNVIIIMPVDGIGIVPGIEKANKAGIPVICIGVTADGGEYIYVGTQYYDAGERQAKYFVEYLPENANVVYLSGTPGHAWSRERMAGFMDYIKTRPDITILAEQTGMTDRAKGMQVMEDWIQSFPKIDGVGAGDDSMVLGALEALKSANRHTGVLVAGVNASHDACVAIKNGEMALSVLQSAPDIAKYCYETIKKIQKGEAVDKEIFVPHINVTIDNVDEYL